MCVRSMSMGPIAISGWNICMYDRCRQVVYIKSEKLQERQVEYMKLGQNNGQKGEESNSRSVCIRQVEDIKVCKFVVQTGVGYKGKLNKWQDRKRIELYESLQVRHMKKKKRDTSLQARQVNEIYTSIFSQGNQRIDRYVSLYTIMVEDKKSVSFCQ